MITHIHTTASNGEASEMDAAISEGIRYADGEDTQLRWAECFTEIETLERMVLAGRGSRGRVDLLVTTDHMRRKSHRFPDGHLKVAARTSRLALGSELATRTRDADGVYRIGPEILAYGSGEGRQVEGPHGPYWGLSQELLDDLYRSCLDDDGNELCTRRAGAFLRERGIVHALSHPLDGHELSFEGTLKIISEFSFIETLNGGHSEQSAELLEGFIRVNNAIVCGASLANVELTDVGRRIVSHIREHGRLIHPWSGSDAHNRDFDRVVISMAVPLGRRPEEVTPGDVFSLMAELDAGSRRGSNGPAFITSGDAVSRVSLLTDVVTILAKNFRIALPKMRNKPFSWFKLSERGYSITSAILSERNRLQALRVAGLARHFNAERLLAALRPEIPRVDTPWAPRVPALAAGELSPPPLVTRIIEQPAA